MTETITHANKHDLTTILEWLRREWEVGGGDDGFWNNRRIIIRALDDEELFVLRDCEDPIAFLVFDPLDGYLSILEVRPERRKGGVGRRLVQWAIEEARRSDLVCLTGRALRQSLGFWTRMGFETNGQDDDTSAREIEISYVFRGESRAAPAEAIPVEIRAFEDWDLTRTLWKIQCVASVEDTEFVLFPEVLERISDPNQLMEVKVDGTVYYCDKMKRLVDRGAELSLPFLRIRRLQRERGPVSQAAEV